MCGITFIFNTDHSPVKKSCIIRMTNSIKFRGPDDTGFNHMHNVSLGHTRLSIVDIKAGSQPMRSNDNRYSIVFNGEIYNYQSLRKELVKNNYVFKTHSDTEVILALYIVFGKACVEKLDGMFSFIIFDKTHQSAFIVRDRLGIKPLYYSWDGKTLVAASEIKAIFASGLIEPKLNHQSIQHYFNYQFSISPNTCFENIYELPPGCFIDVGVNQPFSISTYWDLEFPEDNQYESTDENFWLKKFEQHLNTAANSHLIGEVPIGAYLSGGIDSSATTYLLSKHSKKKIDSFSIHFTNPDADESYAYKPVAQHLGIDNTEITLDDDREGGYFNLFYQCLYHLEQPQRMAVDIPHFLLSDFVQRKNIKVVYTGDGADEILAGYDSFRQDNMRTWGNQLGSEEARHAHYFSEYTRYFSNHYMELLCSLHQPEQQESVINKFGCYPVWFDFWQILEEKLPNLFVNDLRFSPNNQMDTFLEKVKPNLKHRHPLNQSLYIETKTRLPGWILWKSDRLSMAHGVEARVPFLDHKLVELCAQMPPELKLNGVNEKYILKQMVCKHLPTIPGQYKKRGFYTPIREWFFSGDHKGHLDLYLSKQKLIETNIFNPETVQQYLHELIHTKDPVCMDDFYRVMQLEWTLMLILSTQMLHRLYIAKDAPCFHDISQE